MKKYKIKVSEAAENDLENIISYIVYFIPRYFSVNKYICIFNDIYQLDIFNLAELTDMPI